MQVAIVRLFSPMYKPQTIAANPGSQSQSAAFMSRPHQFGRNFSIAASTTPKNERIEPRPGGIVDPELEPALGDAGVAEVSPGEKGAECDPAENDNARNNDARTLPPAYQQEKQREHHVKLIFDRERPGVRESGAALQADVLHRDEKFPERRNLRELPERREGKVNRENDKVCGHDSQGAAHEEAREVDALPTLELREQLSADEITAEDEKKIDTDPAEAMPIVRKREAENAGVIDNDDDDGKRTEKIETGLAFAISKARIDCGLTHGFIDPRNVADSRSIRR
jgi:hypothetical protein